MKTQTRDGVLLITLDQQERKAIQKVRDTFHFLKLIDDGVEPLYKALGEIIEATNQEDGTYVPGGISEVPY